MDAGHFFKKKKRKLWGYSSVGRAPALQAGGQEFDSPRLHQSLISGLTLVGPLFCIQKPRHCGGVKKSLSGEQRKEAPNVIIY